ncbi:putative Ig domain-containing protein, partial [uncultured Mobiluncus sp.]|uniref:putative Ig domain-containing protein n=1 Tax=uncultured Mobiluncus sp. TaxID=293425 RepID=UPI0026215B44
MSILRRLTVAGTALALTLLGLVFPTMAVAQERAAFPGAIDLPTWIIGGREPIESNASPQDNWVVTGKVVTYLSGERAGATDDQGEEPVAGIYVFARYQANNGAWSPIFKATTTSSPTKSKTGRLSNYAIKMRDFVDYNGELGQFRPGEGKAQRLQVWINPEQVRGYRLTFSERTGGVIQGYSTRKDFNWTASQMMQWGFLSVGQNSTQVSQVNIGLIKVAESQGELGLDGVKIEPSLSQAGTGKKVLKGYVRWENQTLNRGGGNAYVGRANIADYPANTPVEGYVVVAAVKNKDNSVEARCTTTTNLSSDDGRSPNWKIYFNNDVDVNKMKFQVFKGTCNASKVELKPLPKRMAYWSPFPTTVDSWGTTLNGISGSANQGWTGTRWEDKVRVLLRPLQMQLLPHGKSLRKDSGTQSFYGDTVKVDYSRLPLNTPLVARLYNGNLTDSGSGKPEQYVSFTADDIDGSIEFPEPLTGDTFKEYWVDVVPEKIAATGSPELQVLASQSFLYKPIQLAISPGVVNENGNFKITQTAPDENKGVKLTECQAVSNTDTTAATDALPYNLTRDTSTSSNGCTLSGTPEKSGTHSLWVKFTFNGTDNKSHTIVQYLPWTVEPRLKPQIEPETPDSEVSQYSPLEKFPAVGVPYSGLVSPFPDWQGRHFTYQVFDTDPGSGGTPLVPDKNGMVSLGESGLKFNTATGQVTGTTQEHESAVFWVKATDEDGGVTPAMKYEIHPGSPLILQRAQLPTGTGGSVYQNANGTPIVIWVSGGEPTANKLKVSGGPELSRNTYANAEILGVYDGDNPNNSVNATNIGGVKCEIQNNTFGGGKFILCSGTPSVSKATTYYLQVKYTDKNGRTLNGAKYTLPQVKALTTLNGSEGWIKMTLLPKITADTNPASGVTSTKLPDGTKGTDYGTRNVKSYLSGGTGKFANYTFSAAGLPAGLTMDADGVITGTPLETTKQEGVSVKVYLRGKDGTAAERSSTSVTFHLCIKTDLKATTETLSATAQGGTTYTSGKPLLDVSSDAGITGGVSPYSYKLQYKDGNGSWQNATTSGGRYQVPNADTNHNPSGLLLDSNGKLVGATMGTAGFPQLRVVVTDSDPVSCPRGCSVNVGLNLKRDDDRRPSVAEDASITANVGEKVTGFLPVNDPSGTPTKFEITNPLNLPEVTLKVNETTGEYTLVATNQAEAGNKGSVTLKVTGANGMVGTVTLRVHVVDQRTPKTNNNVAISLEQGIPVSSSPAPTKVTGAVDAENSPEIECFVPANYTSANCPNAPQKLPGLAGVTLKPDGTLTGTPVKGDVGEHQVPLKALGVNGKWSAEFS